MPKPLRCVTTIAFDLEALSQQPDEAILRRFELVRRVNPAVVPQDLSTDTCRITRGVKAITLRFYRRETPGERGREIFRFRFRLTG